MDEIDNSKFVPTYLYIKKHPVTGMLYFGKTIKNNPEYQGSGKYWNNHLNKHGRNPIEIYRELFYDREDLVEFAMFFSEEFNIVNSDKWANLIPENGITGWPIGAKHSVETLAIMSAKHSGENNPSWGVRGENSPNWGSKRSEESKRKISESNRGLKRSDEAKLNISIATKKAYADGKLVSPWKGKDRSGENNTFFGKTHSDETKRKISLSKIGKGKPLRKVDCPHCTKIGGISSMKRWHFDNCKHKPKVS